MKFARIHVADSTSPAPLYQRFVLDGIRFYRCTFLEGSWQTYHYPKATLYSDMPTCHIQPVGKMIEPTGVWPDQKAGWMSRNETFVVPIGTFTRLAAEDSIRWCCTGIADNERTDYVSTIHLDAGTLLELKQGDNILIAHGMLTNGAKCFEEAKHLKISSKSIQLSALVETYLFKWNSADVKTG